MKQIQKNLLFTSSVESQKGVTLVDDVHWGPEGRYRCIKAVVIAPL